MTTTDDNDILTIDERIGLLEVRDDEDTVVGLIEVCDPDGTVFTIVEPTADVIEIVTSEMVGPQGPQGNAGPAGPAGVQGAVGPQGPFAPIFEQHFAVASVLWVVVHNMDVFPVVDLYDLDGFEISGDVQMPDRNVVVVSFDVPIAGTARLKA